MSKKLMRKKLALMLANLKKKRPFYTEIEYLESTGTQYIDTGYKMSAGKTMTFEGNMMWKSSNGSANFFYGYRSVNSASASGDMRAFFIYGASAPPAGRLAIRYGVNTDNSTSTISKNTNYKISFDGTNLKINDTTFIWLSEAYTPAVYQNMYLFWCNCTGYYSADVAKFSGRIYNWQIFEDGVLVRDFIPVLDWDMTPCMYDKVTKQLFYNQGTGDFVAGREIHPVEYLERPVDAGTGSSMWINTGLKYFADFEVGVSLRESVTNTCLGTSSAERLERNSAAYPQWKFTSAEEGAYASNISIIGYHELKWKDGKIYADGVQLATKAKTSTASTYPMVLFGIPTSETTANAYHNIIYFCKLWHPTEGTLVRDFIPAIDENGVGFMFDQVSHTIYDNAGTGAFSYPAREVEYLESTGAQWINTGIFPTNEMEFESKFTFTSLVSTNLTVIGSRDSTKRCQPIGAYNNKWSASIGGSYDANGSSVSANTSYVVKSIISNGQTITLTVNGNQASVCTSTTGLPNQELYIFGRNFYGNTDPVDSRINAKMYFMKIKAANVLVRDFIPCYKDGVACMVDKLTGTAYTNQGTGSFAVGRIVEPEYE